MLMEDKVKWCSRVSALLMALMLLCQFVPYWHYGEGDALSASVNGYVWFPHHHEELGDELLAADADYSINGVAYSSVLILILCAVGAVLCLWKSGAAAVGILPAGCGAFGLWTYLTNTALQAGGLYWLHLLVLALMLVSGVLGMAAGVRGRKNA